MTAENPPRSVRERILETAMGLFYEKGTNNVGVDEVVERSGVSKMSLYKHFGSKDSLVVACIERWDERWLAWLGTEAASAPTPRERLLAVFDALERQFVRPDFRGCAFVNGAIEIADPEHPAYRTCVGEQEEVRAFLLELAGDADVDDPEELAQQLSILLNGAMVTALVQDAGTTARAARRAAAALLAAS